MVDAETGAPVAGAGVTPRRAGTPFVPRPLRDELAEAPTHSDAGGRFEVVGVVAGLALRVAARGYGSRSIGVGVDEVSVTVRLARGGRIEVRARDAAGAALRGLELALTRVPAGEDGPEPMGLGTTDAEGRFTASDLAAGTYLVKPQPFKPRVPGLSGRQVTVAAGETTIVDLRARADGARLVVTLGGAGDEGVVAVLAPGDHTGVRRLSDAIRAFGTEIVGDSSGRRYTFERLEPGRYTLLLLGLGEREGMLTRLVDVVGPAQAITIDVPAKLPRLEGERKIE